MATAEAPRPTDVAVIEPTSNPVKPSLPRRVWDAIMRVVDSGALVPDADSAMRIETARREGEGK